MIIPPAVLAIAAIVTGVIGPLGRVVQAAAVRFEDQAGYNATVLNGAHITHPVPPFAAGPTGVTATDVLAGLGSVAGALILAGLALYWRRLPLLRGYQPNASLAAAARRFQSGVVNDYVTWVVIGLACLGAAPPASPRPSATASRTDGLRAGHPLSKPHLDDRDRDVGLSRAPVGHEVIGPPQ